MATDIKTLTITVAAAHLAAPFSAEYKQVWIWYIYKFITTTHCLYIKLKLFFQKMVIAVNPALGTLLEKGVPNLHNLSTQRNFTREKRAAWVFYKFGSWNTKCSKYRMQSTLFISPFSWKIWRFFTFPW